MRGTTLGTYMAAAGPSRPYTASASDQAALAGRLKSCSFTIGGNLAIDTTRLNLAHIRIAGTEIPLDAVNGWYMPTNKQVTLNGAACTTWRAGANTAIDFQFPCEIVID
jgi:hypothetical protein